MRKISVAICLIALASCGGAEDNRSAGGVSEAEAEALDRAAEMIDSRRLPDDALRPPAAEGGMPQGQVSGSPQPTTGPT
jgi:hypothetical protein